MRVVQLKLWQVVVAFSAIVLSYVVMGIVLRHAIDQNHTALSEIQKSRLESCQRTYSILNLLIDQSVAQNKKDRPSHKLTKHEKRSLKRFKKILSPKQCLKITTPPPVKRTTTQG